MDPLIQIVGCNIVTYLLLQMSWIQTALIGLLIVDSISAQSCPFRAAFSLIDDLTVPTSIFAQFPDPQLNYYKDELGFTTAEAERVRENAIQHFSAQFGLDFSNIEPEDGPRNRRFLGNATLENVKVPFNTTLVSNHWINNGNTRSRCFSVGSGYFQVTFNGTDTLQGVYGGEEGRPVDVGDFMVYGYFIIYGACAQQPIEIQFQSNIPTRILPVEGWIVQELRLFNRQLGMGRSQSVFKNRVSSTDSTMTVMESQHVMSFP